jgi:anti-sigma regulatory factor (Ser/Thr protein kinase)
LSDPLAENVRIKPESKAVRAGKQMTMRSVGEASGPASGFVHQALIYGSDQEFMDVVLPFVEEGVARREPVLVAVQGRHVENLGVALGRGSEGLSLYAMEDWYETSARTREKFMRWAVERTARGVRARLVGEPPWALAHPAQVRDWARHESVLNLAFADQPVSFICPYDARALPGEVLDHARGAHPELVSGEGASGSPSYEEPLDFCRRLDAAVEAQHGRPSLEFGFGLEDLPAVRRTMSTFAGDVGLPSARAEELVFAVNEVTANAVLHGRPPATLRAWNPQDELVVEITDAGDGITDVLAGQIAPSPTALGGRGLWLVRQLCDAVEVCSDERGCHVTLRVDTAPPLTAA